ncbi:hypothetical protein Bbelb_364590 [Branchiostoma belcheri]|nr:hypothetical protein Bbelb_364590 [Branchiostoma belcheri]
MAAASPSADNNGDGVTLPGRTHRTSKYAGVLSVAKHHFDIDWSLQFVYKLPPRNWNRLAGIPRSVSGYRRLVLSAGRAYAFGLPSLIWVDSVHSGHIGKSVGRSNTQHYQGTSPLLCVAKGLRNGDGHHPTLGQVHGRHSSSSSFIP